MDGVLLIDKPSGPTSHDVVARMRRAMGEKSVGHTGTLDPMATGLLVLVAGKATRLASLLSGGDKSYDATVRFGFATDTDDAQGAQTGGASTVPATDAVLAALEKFRGTHEQVPPAYSAKSVGGSRAYDLARRAKPVALAPVTVTVRSLEWRGAEGDLVFLSVRATAGFYVRALARDLGVALGCGAHLAALRRTGSGSFDISEAWALGEAERAAPEAILARSITPAAALRGFPEVRVNAAGLKRVLHGNPLAPEHLLDARLAHQDGTVRTKVLADDGRLLALAEARGGVLHPVVVLG